MMRLNNNNNIMPGMTLKTATSLSDSNSTHFSNEV